MDRLVQIILRSSRLFPVRARSSAPRWILDMSSASFACPTHLVAPLAFWLSESVDFAFSVCLIGSVIDLPSAIVCLALFYSAACRSPIILLNVLKVR